MTLLDIIIDHIEILTEEINELPNRYYNNININAGDKIYVNEYGIHQ